MFTAAYYAGRTHDDRKPAPAGNAAKSACSRHDQLITSAKNSNEIFFNLDNRRVFYDSTEGYLYFTDSPTGSLIQTVRATLTGLNSSATIEQIYLDPHRFFSGACRVRLLAEHVSTLLIALRLAGIRTTVR